MFCIRLQVSTTDLSLSPRNEHRIFCTHIKMDDPQIHGLENLTDKMNAAHLKISELGSSENSMLDTKESCRSDETLSLSPT